MQHRLDDLARAEREAERRHQAVLQEEARWRQQQRTWEAERAQRHSGDLVALFRAAREARGTLIAPPCVS